LPARVNQHVAIIRPREETLHPRVLECYLISSRAKRELLHTAGGGATREAITKAQILRLSVPVPARVAQDAFVRAMSSLDQIRDREKNAAAIDESLFIALQSRAFRGELEAG